MTTVAQGNGACRGACWLIGIVTGGYLAFILVNDFQQDFVRSMVPGLAAALLVGLLFRRLFCHGRSNRVRDRIIEARSREVEIKAKRVAQLAENPQDSQSDGAAVEKPAPTPKKTFDAPEAGDIDRKLDEQIISSAISASTASDEGANSDEPPSPAKPATLRLSEKDAANDNPKPGNDGPKHDANPSFENPATTGPESWPNPDEMQVKRVETVKKTEMADKGKIPDLPTGIAAMMSAELKEAALIAEDVNRVETPPTAVEPTPPAKPEIPAATEPTTPASEDSTPKIAPVAPKSLVGPKNGKPDDLTRIAGLEDAQIKAMNTAGIFHFSQIVNLNRRELAWLDQNIPAAADNSNAGDWRKAAIALVRKGG